ncbi:MAG: ribonuclease H-like domain-containing protein [Clostridiales bacterium]|nr:ribonuclease H-like domain-containing protein [Clostridiales bacterium]
MLIINDIIDIPKAYQFEALYNLEKIVYFDIETTGLSANTSYLYLIGCIYYKDSSYHLIQWFSEDIEEEELLLCEFFQFIKDFDILVNYNGNSFDIPYLIRKCNQYKVAYSFDQIEHLDIYKKILPYKKIFKLDNYKQKSIETFLDIKREDTFSGGQLIEVYQSYLGKKSIENLRKIRFQDTPSLNLKEADHLLKQLLLHNADDLKGLASISSILSYSDMFEQPIEVTRATLNNEYFIIDFKLFSPVPKPLSFGNWVFNYSVDADLGCLKVKAFTGEFKYFYSNYKDYYYLPLEDRAIHKSVASFVDEGYKEKAKAATCYTKKQGTFLPQYDTIITPAFKQSYQDKVTYFEVNEDLLSHIEAFSPYVSHIINHMVKSR